MTDKEIRAFIKKHPISKNRCIKCPGIPIPPYRKHDIKHCGKTLFRIRYNEVANETFIYCSCGWGATVNYVKMKYLMNKRKKL